MQRVRATSAIELSSRRILCNDDRGPRSQNSLLVVKGWEAGYSPAAPSCHHSRLKRSSQCKHLTTMTPAQEHHEHNKETLAAVASALPPSSAPKINPLLSRGKLKPAKKPNANTKKVKKGKAKDLVQDVQAARQDELNVVSGQDGSVDVEEEGDVLDLADQLLEQLDSKLGEASDAPVVSDKEIEPQSSNASASSASSRTSTGSTGSARERFQGFKEGVKDAFMPNRSHDGEKKVSRQQARKLRRANHFEEQRQQAAAEVLAENDQSVERERSQIDAQLKKLKVHVKEVEPDGHCLFSAIADQANFLKLSSTKEDYTSTRTHAANYLRAHPDDFLPFLVSDADPDAPMSPSEYARYCDTVEKTAEWGGEPEVSLAPVLP
ncbi:hypothetical protein JCM10212_000351, partial [Sporobolomyces blumeae]